MISTLWVRFHNLSIRFFNWCFPTLTTVILPSPSPPQLVFKIQLGLLQSKLIQSYFLRLCISYATQCKLKQRPFTGEEHQHPCVLSCICSPKFKKQVLHTFDLMIGWNFNEPCTAPIYLRYHWMVSTFKAVWDKAASPINLYGRNLPSIQALPILIYWFSNHASSPSIKTKKSRNIQFLSTIPCNKVKWNDFLQ